VTTDVTDCLLLLSEAQFDAEPDGSVPKRMSGIAYSGGRVPGRNIVIDLSTTTVVLPAPLLASHDSSSIVGRIISAAVGRTLKIDAELYSDIDEDALLIAKKAKRGHPWQLSVGLFGYDIEAIAPGKKIKVNGRDFVGPIDVLRNGAVREVSIVALGADPDTSATFLSIPGASSMADQADQVARFAALASERDTARARVTELEAAAVAAAAQIATLTAERDAAVAAVARADAAVRLAAVQAMFSAVGWEFKPEAAAPYVALSAEAFDAVSKDITSRTSRAPTLPQHLMQSLTPEGSAAGSAASGSALLSVVRHAHGVK
jgi:hypothetical protein